MSSMLYVLARWTVRARAFVVMGWVLILAVCGVGALTLGTGMDNSVSIPGTESGDALDRLSATFPEVSGSSAQVLVVGPESSDVTAQPAAAAINRATDVIADIPLVEAVTTLDDSLMAATISDDQSTALITVQLAGIKSEGIDNAKVSLADVVETLNVELPEGYSAHLGGSLFATDFPELSVTEGVGVLVALVVLFFTLGTFIAAGLPLINALVGVLASVAIIFAGTSVITINSTTPLLAIMLGLAVGIDYSLFIVSRHRDQLRQGMAPKESIAHAVGTAGSAVVFAGLTVMIALVGLGVAGIPFLTTMGVAGAGAVGVAVLVALTLLPALLSFAGMRILTKKERKALQEPIEEGEKRSRRAAKPNRFFAGWIAFATKVPALTVVILVVGLGALALPATQLRLALPDAGVLPASNDARITYDLIAKEFGEGFNGPLIVTTPIVTSTDPIGLMEDLADELRDLPGVADVPLATPNQGADTGIVQVVPTGAPNSVETEQLVHDIRQMHDRLQQNYDVDIAVTGLTAVGIDVSAKLMDALLPFALVVVGLSLILLTIVFRSIAVPVTAAIGYLLSVAASFGVVTLVFEQGFLADFFSVSRLGPIINFMPIVVMGVLFGLSMDYEVFLVSRMREDYVHTGKARQSIVTGFMSTAKVVTAAAVIMVAVFAAFVPEGDANIKPIALGLAIGVAIDAFVVRMTLIPALMMLLGDKAWWIPRWLDKALPTFDIEGAGIQRQRALKDWPSVPAVLAAKNLQIGEGAPISLLVPENWSLRITGESTAEVRDLLLTLSGRLQPVGGDLKVGDYLLPERAGAVRRRVALLTDEGGEPLGPQIERALDEDAMIIAALITDPGASLEYLADVPAWTSLIVGGVSEDLSTFNHPDWEHIELSPNRSLATATAKGTEA